MGSVPPRTEPQDTASAPLPPLMVTSCPRSIGRSALMPAPTASSAMYVPAAPETTEEKKADESEPMYPPSEAWPCHEKRSSILLQVITVPRRSISMLSR